MDASDHWTCDDSCCTYVRVTLTALKKTAEANQSSGGDSETVTRTSCTETLNSSSFLKQE